MRKDRWGQRAYGGERRKNDGDDGGKNRKEQEYKDEARTMERENERKGSTRGDRKDRTKA